jgi:hypothetical protein
MNRHQWQRKHSAAIAVVGLLLGVVLTAIMKRSEFLFAGGIWFCTIFFAAAISVIKTELVALHRRRAYYLAACNLTYQSAFVLLPAAFIGFLLSQLAKLGQQSFFFTRSQEIFNRLAGSMIMLGALALLAGVICILLTPLLQPLVSAGANRLGGKQQSRIVSAITSYTLSFMLIGILGGALTLLFQYWRR